MKKLHFFLISLFITIPCIAEDCLKETAPEYDTWVLYEKQPCWCYKKQCRGDANGSLFLGKPVTLADLNLFIAAFNQPYDVLRRNPELICADFDHSGFINKLVTLSDLIIFKKYFNKADSTVPCCDLDEDCILTPEDKYNFWTD